MGRISHFIDVLSKGLLIGILSIMAMVVLLQVVFRYLLNLPLFWTEEFARYCLVWASFLGAGIGLKRGEHIAVTVFVERYVSQNKAKAIGYLVDILIFVILVVIFVGGISLVRITSSQTSPALRIPMALPYLAIPIGSAVMIIHQLADCYRRLILGGVIKTKITLNLATVTPVDHAYNRGAVEFVQLVKEGSKGMIDIQLYPSGQLSASEEGIIKKLQMGTIDLAVVSTGPLNSISPDIGIVDLPFLFQDAAHAEQVLDGPIGGELLESMNRVKGLAFFENGFRHFTNSVRPLQNLDDFEDLKIRIMDNPIHYTAIRHLNAKPVSMAWGKETINALKNKTVDGQENPVGIIWANRMDGYQKYMSLTGHFYSAAPLCTNKKTFDSLKIEWQQLFLEAARRTTCYQRNLVRKAEQQQIAALKSSGMDVRSIDTQPFASLMKDTHQSFFLRYPAWKQTVQKILKTPNKGKEDYPWQ